MSTSIPDAEAQALTDLRASLLAKHPRKLGPTDGREAFEEHKRLASIVHRVTRLEARGGESETAAWLRYFTECFPSPRNGAEDARLLFGAWRTKLLKDDAPGPSAALTHGQPSLHWERDARGPLCIDLESMWDDFAQSLDTFVAHLRLQHDRRKVALKRWRETQWTVDFFQPAGDGSGLGATAMSVSAARAVTGNSGLLG
jgi:hypothetical protein